MLYHVIKNTVAKIINEEDDGKVGRNTVELPTAILYSDWLYFSMAWHKDMPSSIQRLSCILIGWYKYIPSSIQRLSYQSARNIIVIYFSRTSAAQTNRS